MTLLRATFVGLPGVFRPFAGLFFPRSPSSFVAHRLRPGQAFMTFPVQGSLAAGGRSGSADLWAEREPAPQDAGPRIVALGGGTGLPAVLQGLANAAAARGVRDPASVTGVVTVTDDGGSSGRLREQYGVLPPGDARNCLLALTVDDSYFRDLLQHRLDEGPGVVGHPVGNLLLTALTQRTGDFSQAIEQLGVMIGSRGRVLPATLENVRLRAVLESGETINGETRIVQHPSPIRRLSLEPRPKAHPEVLSALAAADGIVVGPGSLYTSVLPNLLVEGVASTMRSVRAVRIYVANLMTEPGETDQYSLDDHLRAIRAHVGCDLFDFVLVNRRPVNHAAVQLYAERGSQPVAVDRLLKHAGHAQLVECDLATEQQGAKIRHHPDSLARAIRALVAAGRPVAEAACALVGRPDV
jgi:uncharacterized cofD-like protein